MSKNSVVRSTIRSSIFAATVAGAALALTGCYVVPLNQQTSHAPATVYIPVAAPTPPAPVTFAARLYPSNDLATSYGMVSAVVTNDLNGRGTFSTAINGENFMGEATRSNGNLRTGVANGTGNWGSYINCTYQMNSATLGSGQCKLSNGALFTMHVGS
jgi:hypothetical protein